MDNKQRQKLLTIFFCLAVVLGAIYGIFQKMLYLTKGESVKFDHPYFVAFLLSLSNVAVYPIYLIKERMAANKIGNKDSLEQGIHLQNVNETLGQTNDEDENSPPKKINKLLFAIPAFLDSVENVLKNISLTMISQSIVQMLRSSVMVYCALLALIFLKKRLFRHHWTSIVTIVLGVSLVGYSYLTGGTAESKNIVVGLIVLQIGQLFGAVAYVAEEKFLGDFDNLDPLILVVGEGIAGSLMFIVILPILQFIPCDSESLCSNGKAADTWQAFKDFGANPMLIVYAIAMVIACTFLAASQMMVVKYGSAAQKTTADILRPMFIWLFFMTV